jgi:hypothetical protein
MIIATSLTSNNFIDAPLIAQEYNKPILKWGKQHFPRCKQMSSQESEGGSHRTHLNPKTFLARTFPDIAFLDITVNTPAYMVLLIIPRSLGIKQFIYNNINSTIKIYSSIYVLKKQ